jgi:iron complex outermembrane receptor protein
MVLLVLLTSFTTPILAQDTEEAEYETGALEEVMVTAQRREQNLQDVPVSVTAITAKDLELKQINNIRDLQYQVPNISLATNTGTASGARVFLRGIGEDESRVSADPAVGIYVDGIYIGRQVGAMLDLLDLERIEVLRGPQGTLYGRNTNAGAIKLISVKPQNENTFEVKLTAGTDSLFNAKATGNWAFSESTAVRASFITKNRDGFHDLNPNGDFANQGREVGDIETRAFRIAFAHDFGNSWRANLAFDYTQDDSDPIPDSAAPGDDADNNLFTIEPLPGTVCNELTPVTFQPMGCFLGYSSEVEQWGVNLSITGEIGDFDFTSLTGLREMEDHLASRIGFPYFQHTDQEQFSQEFTLASNFDGAFDFLGGLFYYTEDVVGDTTFIFDFILPVDTEALAAFFNGTYEFNDQWTLTAGVRYTEEEKNLDAANLTFGAPFARKDSANFNLWTYKLALDYKINDEVMAFTSYSTGFKSGGWSPDCFSVTACFQPVTEEKLDSFELGLRTDLANDTVRLNVTYFSNQYDGLQIGATVPGLGFTRFNVGESEIQGVEVEMDWQATENLRIFGNIGLLDAKYTSVTLSQAGGLTNSGAACPGGIVTIKCALGLELKNAPEYKGSVGGVYKMMLSGGNFLTFGGDLSFEDTSWSLVANGPPHALTDVDAIINARITYGSGDGKWEAALWGRNLTDEEYSRSATANSFTQYASAPLQLGVDFRYLFD